MSTCVKKTTCICREGLCEHASWLFLAVGASSSNPSYILSLRVRPACILHRPIPIFGIYLQIRCGNHKCCLVISDSSRLRSCIRWRCESVIYIARSSSGNQEYCIQGNGTTRNQTSAGDLSVRYSLPAVNICYLSPLVNY